MANQQSNYDILIAKLDGFIRKYYLNQLIRGLLYTVGVVLALFILINVLEYFFFFGTSVRKVMFFAFVGVSALSIIRWMIIPGMHYFQLGKLISHEQAASIIGNHFQDVKDQLLNILQLNDIAQSTDNDLVFASINQKSEKIKLVPFKSAINLNQNKKYLRYSLPPLLLLLALLFGAPSVIKDSTNRLVNNNQEFNRPAPFHFSVLNEELKAVQFGDFEVLLETEGDVIPHEVFIDIDGIQYRMNKQENNQFSYQIHNLQKDVAFHFFSGRVNSSEYELEVLKKPNIAEFEIQLDYPAYTGRKDERLANIGDISVPEGTVAKWVFKADNTDDIGVRFGASAPIASAKRQGRQVFYFSRKLAQDVLYRLFISNEQLPMADSVQYQVAVVPDLNPVISLKSFPDSTVKSLVYLTGDASDDYGLTSLTFNYKIKKENGVELPVGSTSILSPSGKDVVYDYVLDMEELNLDAGDEMTYYFEVKDNDMVNGHKSARTQLMSIKKPSISELKKQEKENNEQIKKDLQEAIQNSRDMKEEMRKIREKLLEEKEMDWQAKKNLEKLLERQQQLQEQFNQAKQQFDENLNNQENTSPPNEQLQEKQEKLQELFEEAMSDEMQELMQQIQELLQELEKEDAIEKMEEFEMSDEELEQEMDRMLELFKQLEVEKEMQEQIEELEKLAEEQEALSEETKNEEKSNEELKQEQEDINKKFDEIQKKQEELEKKNEELKRPMEMDDQDENMEDIEQDMEDSQEQLDQQDNQGAAKSQKSAAQKMKDMANSMSASMMQSQSDQMAEDIQAMRQLLENLVTLSYGQEALKDEFGVVAANTPRFIKMVEEQHKLKDDFKIVEDSLRALASRVVQIESFVLDKVSDIKKDMKSSIDELEERKVANANNLQHSTMKNLNDLALMLAESMEQMQQQMSSMMQGNQMCNKPGQGQGKSGKVPMDKISEGQKGITEQMKKLKEDLKNGKKPGGMSKKFAQMAAKQAALREALRKLNEDKQGEGKGSKAIEDIIKQMDDIETDLVNKKLDNEMLKRQEDIMTRLLEAEKAERKRKMDDKRKSKSAQQIERKLPPELEDYIKARKAEVASFKTISPQLKNYYKTLVEEYIDALQKEQ